MTPCLRTALLCSALALTSACSGGDDEPGQPSTPPLAASSAAPSAGPSATGVDLTSLISTPPGEGWISDSGGPVVVTEENAAEAYSLTAEQAVGQIRQERERGVVDAATEQWTREAPVSLSRTTVRRYEDEVFEYPVAPVAVPLPAPAAPPGVTTSCHLLPASALDGKTFAGSCSVTWPEERINAVVSVIGTDEAELRAAIPAHTQVLLDDLPA